MNNIEFIEFKKKEVKSRFVTGEFVLMSKDDVIKELWKIIDNIDTIGDIAKSDNKLYRKLVEKEQLKRWNFPIKTDGYELDLSNIESDWSMEIKSKKRYRVMAKLTEQDLLSGGKSIRELAKIYEVRRSK